MKPRKHAELIKAWADGAEIEWEYEGEWFDAVGNPEWQTNVKYRIKPEPKPDIYCMEYFYLSDDGDWMSTNCSPANLKLTFDGETNKLKSAEVLK